MDAVSQARIEREVYRKGRFAVLEAELQGRRVRLAGELPPLPRGAWIEGVFTPFSHPRYGPTYQVRDLREVCSLPEAGVWLAERLHLSAVPDPATAQRALREGPSALTGLSPQRQPNLSPIWPQIQAEWQLVQRGLSPESARLLWRVPPESLQANPYPYLLEGLTRPEADRLAQRHGREGLAPQGQILEELLEQARQGHTFPPYPHPLPEPVRPLLNTLLYQEPGRLGLARYVEAERAIARFFRRPTGRKLRLGPPPAGLTEEQRQLWPRVEEGHALLSGGPGTGKSYTCAALLEAAHRARLEVILLAPTGKAAVRLSELADHQAYTVHARLGWDGERFAHGPHHPLPADLVVVDEASMADVELLAALIAALPPQAHLLLVGDADQLPPVGPGAPFQDLLQGPTPQVRLTQLQRRAQQHPVTRLSYQFRSGQLEAPHSEEGLSWRLGETPQVLQWLLEDAKRLWGRIRFQTLAPVYRGPLGIEALNRSLKEWLNPGGLPDWRLGGLPVAPGDPLIQLRNDYALGLANGQLMEVQSADAHSLLVRLDDGSYKRIPRSQSRHLRHAFAISIHRSQGSQWPCVLLVVAREHGAFVNREMLYTGLTRSQHSAILYGQLEAYREALTRRASGRQTWLGQRRLP